MHKVLTSSINKGHRRSDIILSRVSAFLVSCATFIIYLPALKNGFVSWDDNTYVFENPMIQSLDLGFLIWVFSAEANPIWHPLTLFSLAIDYSIWGLNPKGYHLTNILIHAVNTFLVALLAFKLIERVENGKSGTNKKNLIAGIVTAVLFGIHPLHVESVAWISERKDVLYALFYLLSLLIYLKYIAASDKKRYAYYVTCLGFFALSLLSKPMAVSLPIVLLIFDYYPLKRITAPLKAVLIEKIPFFLLSLASSFVTVTVHHKSGTSSLIEEYSLSSRIFETIYAYVFYLQKMILPVGLAPYYSLPININFFTFKYFGSLILLIAITYFVVTARKKNKLFFSVWLYYILTLIPTIGIIKVSGSTIADRYTYLPSLGPFLLIGLAVEIVYERYSKKEFQIAITVMLSALTLLLSKNTVTQISIWHDSITFWSYEIKLFPDTFVAYYNRGQYYWRTGQHLAAISDYDTAIMLKPLYAPTYINRGLAYFDIGSYANAINDYNRAIGLEPRNADAYINRGNSYIKIGNYKEAINDFDLAIKIEPQYSNSYNNRGLAHYYLGDYTQAGKDLSQAISLNPQDPDAYYNLALVYSKSGKAELAQVYFNKAAVMNK